VAPHRRIEEKEEQQHKMEKAFEDLYMTATGYFIFYTVLHSDECCKIQQTVHTDL